MSRKAKISMVAALALVGAVVISMLPGQSKDPLRVDYVGLSPTNSRCVVFAISNMTQKPIDYTWCPYILTNRPVNIVFLLDSGRAQVPPPLRTIPSRGTTTFTEPVESYEGWLSIIIYVKPRSTNYPSSPRKHLATWATAHNWTRLANWLHPPPRLKLAYGPEMFGDKPMAAGPK